MTDTQTRLKIMREIALKADGFYERSETLGKIAAKAITNKHRSQVTNLESIANSAIKVTDVLNYLKTQTARKAYWCDREQLGPALLKEFNLNLAKDKDEICKSLNLATDSGAAQQIHLYLIREFVRQFAAQYEYECMTQPEETES